MKNYTVNVQVLLPRLDTTGYKVSERPKMNFRVGANNPRDAAKLAKESFQEKFGQDYYVECVNVLEGGEELVLIIKSGVKTKREVEERARSQKRTVRMQQEFKDRDKPHRVHR